MQNFLIAISLLCGLTVTLSAAPATLTKAASFEFHGGHRIYPTGTAVEATPAANGQVKATAEDGGTALLPASGVLYAPAPPPKPIIPANGVTPSNAPYEAGAADLTTISGKTYRQARVFRVEPDGINYAFDGGIVKILFNDLPERIRKQYSYDPKRAELFQDQDQRQQAQLQMDAATRSEIQRQQTAAIFAQQAREEQLKQATEKLAASRHKVITTIRQVISPNAAICHGVLYLERIQTYSDATICIVGIPANAVDGQQLITDTYPCGIFRYTTVLGAGSTIEMYATTPEKAAALLAKQPQ
jgi:hypothetical protein